MPIYEYQCPVCGHKHDVIAKSPEEVSHVENHCIGEWWRSDKLCGHDETEMELVFPKTSPPKFMGSGFHANDYPTKKS